NAVLGDGVWPGRDDGANHLGLGPRWRESGCEGQEGRDQVFRHHRTTKLRSRVSLRRPDLSSAKKRMRYSSALLAALMNCCTESDTLLPSVAPLVSTMGVPRGPVLRLTMCM